MKLNSYLVRSRHGIYYLRLQRHGQDKRVSLRTKDFKKASIAAYNFGVKMSLMTDKKEKIKFATAEEVLAEENLAAQFKNYEIQQRAYARLEALKDKQAEDDLLQMLIAQDSKLAQIAQPQTVINQQPPSLSLKKTCLRDAINDYKPALAKTKQAEKSKKMALSTLNGLAEILGADFDMSLLDDEAIEYTWLVARLAEVAATTAKRDLSFIRAFVSWAAHKNRMYCPAPLTLKLDAKGEHWKYLDSSDLKALFSNLTSNSEKPWQFWIPILGLYTGGRIGELASLKTSYFFEKSGLQVMHLAGTKTDASPRDLPLHKDLIVLGLLEYVSTRRNAKHEMLFDITKSEQNGWGAAATKWYSAYKVKCGVNDDLKVFHSFRHTITDLMNQVSVGHKAQCQYTGHSSASDVHSKVYGRGALSLQVMQDEVVSKIDWQQYCNWQPDLIALKEKADTFI